ncbi:MAG: T9SS type A sorting domain-containing protein [Flavobacteriales bacterium]|nr:T9SS type A sorting domain-containing protein [Flavobacteriales bacterium]
MKKIYLSFSLLLMGAATMAQSLSEIQINHAVGKEVMPVEHSSALDATDTLGLADFGTEIWQYGSPSGFVFGTNDLEGQVQGQTVHQLNFAYAAGYIVNTEYNVTGAMIWFGGKEDVSGSPADLTVQMFSLADNKAYSNAQVQSPDVIGPNQQLGSATLAFDDVDTTDATYVMFANPLWTNTDFALAVDITDLYGAPADTVWIYASEDGASDGSYTWSNIGFDIAPTRIWALTTGLLQGGLDVNLAIFAIVAESGVGIEEQGFLNGVKMTTYPNPAVSAETVRIQYGLENAADKVEINILDMSGKLVYTVTEGTKAAGIHTINIPAGTLSAGSYIYSLQANGGRMAKRLEVLK